LDDVLKVMEEVYRISSDGAQVKVIVPYFRSRWACIDPTHQHFFTVDSFAYFDPDSEICRRYDYTLARFKLEQVVFNETIPGGLTKRLMTSVANRKPRAYETYLSHLFPLDDITFYLRTVK